MIFSRRVATYSAGVDQEGRAISMIDEDGKPSNGPASQPGKPRRSRLRQILDERPEARPRLGRAIAILCGTTLVAFAAFGALFMWHIVRRGRIDPGTIKRSSRGSHAGIPIAGN